jgi:hypothetical protein
MVGSEVALARMKPTQLVESDEIALNLMNHQGWDLRSAASVLQFDDPDSTSPQNGWMQDLQISDVQLQRMVADEDLAIVLLEDDYIVAEAEPIAEEEPAAKIGFEDYDPSKDLEEAVQDLPAEVVAVEPAAETNADVIVEAIQAH